MTNALLILPAALICVLMFGLGQPAIAAGTETTTRLQTIVTGKEAVVARHSSWNRKCESLEIPIVKIDTPPKHGRIQSNPTEFKPTRTVAGGRYTECLGKEMTGTAVTYVADAGYVGGDEFSYVVRYAKRPPGQPKEISHRIVLSITAEAQSAKTAAQMVSKEATATPATAPLATPPTHTQTTPQSPIATADLNRTKELAQVQQTLKDGQKNLAKQQVATSEQLAKVENALGGIVLPAWSNPSEWMMRVAAVPIQQQQFCRIVDRFYGDLEQVYQTRNEIKQNALYRDRKLDLATLLPAGQFDNWVVQVKEVVQAADGSAAVMLQPPCRAMLGSDACQKDPSKIRATISVSSPLYRELARVSAGDFVVVSGKILYAETADPDRPLPTYAVFKPGEHCSSADGAKQADVFVTEIRYLVQLR